MGIAKVIIKRIAAFYVFTIECILPVNEELSNCTNGLAGRVFQVLTWYFSNSPPYAISLYVFFKAFFFSLRSGYCLGESQGLRN